MASDGDKEAIEKILNHYNAYISKACLRPFYDEYGDTQIIVDRELKGRIQTAITRAILKFEMEIK
ncbi:helix-turn-helix domain-containing protein [Hungatella effluvii]|jgi:hypothetical protein